MTMNGSPAWAQADGTVGWGSRVNRAVRYGTPLCTSGVFAKAPGRPTGTVGNKHPGRRRMGVGTPRPLDGGLGTDEVP
jgi:hypothetical protein